MFSALIQGRKDRTIISPKDSKVMSYKITQLAREIMEIKERKKKTPTKPNRKTTAGFSFICDCCLDS